jgi:hypothetical protein
MFRNKSVDSYYMIGGYLLYVGKMFGNKSVDTYYMMEQNVPK